MKLKVHSVSYFLLFLWTAFFLNSCGSLNQNKMFQTTGEVISDTIIDAIAKSKKNYIIKRDDYLDIAVYTNKGERLVDPNQEMGNKLGVSAGAVQNVKNETFKYLVESNGEVKLPLIGYLMVQGYNLRQLDSLLQVKYSEYYEDVFVLSSVINKRVFVLGNSGNKNDVTAKVITLDNENMTVIEVLTLAGGLDQYAKTNRIRLIRGDLKNPNVYFIDLSTIEGVRKSHLNVQPNDIIYVERQRRVLLQLVSEMAPFVVLLNTLLLLYIATKTRL